MNRSIALILIWTLAGAAVVRGQDDPDYLKTVQAFADAMIEKGRDVYGTEPSPLFAAALDRNTSRLLEAWPQKIRGYAIQIAHPQAPTLCTILICIRCFTR